MSTNELSLESRLNVFGGIRLSPNCRYPIPELVGEVGTLIGFDDVEAVVQWGPFFTPKRHLRESLEAIRSQPIPKKPTRRGRRKKVDELQPEEAVEQEIDPKSKNKKAPTTTSRKGRTPRALTPSFSCWHRPHDAARVALGHWIRDFGIRF